ncbi:DUF1702 family protein [Streptosporangium algeriense]|uniref:DUF1702 family protein n=1 Tax=Streptosporangium algeriense TaxID=1682748 RepID=A0ABW3DTQ3_9ACTN
MRRFRLGPAREHLESAGRACVTGHNAVITGEPERIDDLPEGLRGFAYEGAGMACASLDVLTVTGGRRLRGLLSGQGMRYPHLIHLGAGRGYARLRMRPMWGIRSVHPLLRWLAFDGFGFHQGFYAADRTVGRQRTAGLLDRTSRAIFDQGVGRMLWFHECAGAEGVAACALEHDLIVITDEIYEKVRYAGEHISLASLPGMADRTVTVNGFSKGYAMTGWRLGYVAAPADISAEMLKVQQHTVGCAGSFVQRGGLSALTGPQDAVERMTAAYAARRDLLVDGLNELPGLSCPKPDGALYVFCDVSGTGFDTSADFTAWLLRQAGVAVTPGSAFGPGGEGYVRFAFSTSEDVLREALNRMRAALATR